MPHLFHLQSLVRITLKKAYTDGTIAVDMDPLSLLCRLATSVPPPRLHTIRYAGVLAAASAWRSRLAPQSLPQGTTANDESGKPDHAGGCRPWAELLARTFAVDVLTCPNCQGRMRLLAVIKEPANIARYLAAAGGIGQSGPHPGRGETASQRSLRAWWVPREAPPSSPARGGLTAESPSYYLRSWCPEPTRPHHPRRALCLRVGRAASTSRSMSARVSAPKPLRDDRARMSRTALRAGANTSS